jgi:hypothetical protein
MWVVKDDGLMWERCAALGPRCGNAERGWMCFSSHGLGLNGIAPAPLSEELPTEWADERADVLNRFTEELTKATGDGSRKRQAGEKPPWYEDNAHEAAIFSHLTKWKRGELVDPDSGAHPLVHAAWRCLAIACRESGNVPS